MIGKTLDHYRIVGQIGAGGMGVVYKAIDERLEREVAVKVLPDSALFDEESRLRFRREALALSKVNHPHIATVHDFYTQDGTDFLVMEYLAGVTLVEKLADGPLPEREAARLGRQIAEGLQSAHDTDIVHRDLKPGNVMVSEQGHIKILDFGLAKSLVSENDDAPTALKTGAGVARGTLPYMSPEQLLGKPIGPTSDVYAAGAVLYEMTTGRRPFLEQGAGLVDAILNREPERPSDVTPEVSPEMERIILKALQKDPAKRYESAADMAADLDALITGSSPAVSGAGEDAARFGDRRRALLAAVALVAIFTVFALASVWLSQPQHPADVTAVTNPVVAVLPLANLSGDDTMDHIGLGIAHTLTTSLAAIPSLTMVSPSETTEYSDAPARPGDVAQELGANFVVTGAVQRAGDQLHLTLNLVRPDSSIAWGGETQGSVGDLFAIQRRLASDLSSALQLMLTDADRERLDAPPTLDTDAFSDYTQAQAFLDRSDVPGNVDRALGLFDAAVARDPGFALAHAGLGEAYWAKYVATRDASWTERAREATLEALRLDPNRAAVRYSLAVIYNGTGHQEEAIDELRRAIQLQPNGDDAHRLLAEILQKRGETEEAFEEFQRAVDVRPNYWGNHRALGLAYYQEGRFAEATESVRRMTELQPDLPQGFQILGVIYHSTGDLENARKNYERAIELGPSPASYSNLGTIHYRQGNYAEAARMYEQALELGPNSPTRHRNLGDARLKLGDTSGAREAYSRARELTEDMLQVNPRDALELARLGVYEAKLGDVESARRHSMDALALAPTDGDVLYCRAAVLALTNQQAEAIKVLAQAFDRGYPRKLIVDDNDFEGLHSLPAFRALIEE